MNAPPDLLYLELAAIGLTEKTIKPSVLGGYPEVLAAAEVQRRVRADPQRRDATIHASSAIRDALADMVVPLDRLIGQAALCATSRFEGLRVVEREQLLLESTSRITHNMYKVRRRRALTHVVNYLSRDIPEPTGHGEEGFTGAESNYEEQDEVASVPDVVAYGSARLHYAALTCLFRDGFEVWNPNPGIYLSSRWEAWDACEDRLLECAIDFAEVWDGPDEDVLQSLGHVLSNADLAALRASQHTIRSHTPVLPFGIGEARNRYYIGLIDGETLDDPLWDLRKAVWRPWYQDAPDLEAIAAASGQIMLVMGRCGGRAQPAAEEARHAAYKTLAYFFDYDEFVPIFGGLSLREHAAAYFDAESARLANDATLWHTST